MSNEEFISELSGKNFISGIFYPYIARIFYLNKLIFGASKLLICSLFSFLAVPITGIEASIYIYFFITSSHFINTKFFDIK